MDFIAIIAAPFMLAWGMIAARYYLRADQQGGLLSGMFGIAFLVLLTRLPALEQGAITLSLDWMPQLGLALSLYIDGLALLFALLVTGIASAVFFYGGYYMDDQRQAGHFFALLLAFTGSMLLLVMAGNLLTLFIAWELTSIISFLLISFKGKDAEARRGASQALVITGGGGLALLVGLLLAGSVTGSMEFATILTNGDLLQQSPLYAAITCLILIGCFSKSAQFPLHFWLPEAMSAPTPASAFLHSATMVKAGIYLLARFYPVLGNTDLWTTLLTSVGLITLFVGAILALRQKDLKGMLAFSTISQLGALVALIGQPDSAGLKAAMVGVLAHALYKCSLFLVVGAVDHATGTRNIDELGGLHRLMRGFALVTVLVGLSMAGVPPLMGFVSKELLLEAFISSPLTLVIIVSSAVFTVTLALRLYVDVFLGKQRLRLPQPDHVDHDQHHPLGDDAHDYSPFHTLPRLMVMGPALLAVLSLVAGIGITPLIEPLVEPAVGKDISLYLFPPGGINLAFTLSMLALALGASLFAVRRVWLAWSFPTLITGPQVYRRVIKLIESGADGLLKSQGGKIRYYLVVILISVIVLLLRVITNAEQMGIRPTPIVVTSIVDILKAILLILALGATLASILFEKHLIAALSLGIAGYAIGGIFLLEPAPDVALVQFLVETLATVLIIIILARTSQEERHKAIENLWDQSQGGIIRDIAVSAALGIAVMLFALAAVSSRPTPNPIAAWHLDNALPQLGVNDVVAGIITDFRGTDTLIEITVFGIAALGILTLLARPKPGKTLSLFGQGTTPEDANAIQDAIQEDADRPESLVYRSQFNDPITRVAAIPLLPIAMMIALAHILYAGAAPGDGFTAGVISGLGITLWFVVFGYEEVKKRLRWLRPTVFIGVGLLVAFTNALLPLVFGREFMAFTTVTGVSIANIKLASSLVFEIGICLTVFGGISAILEAISHPREVESV
jgi:NADH:ubiquinone oxidoreductase subunit 5 (subunit L)/multisubunit Na+/H+ antiporter MnhA subunit